MTTTPDTPLVDLDELVRLAKAATPGPWCQHPNGTSAWQGESWESINYSEARAQNTRHVCNATSVDEAGIADIELIVAMRNSIDALIAETRALRAKAQCGGWIPCSERMPPRQELVVIAVTCMGHQDTRGGYHLDDHWVDSVGDKLELYEVTHWREYPAPPEAP